MGGSPSRLLIMPGCLILRYLGGWQVRAGADASWRHLGDNGVRRYKRVIIAGNKNHNEPDISQLTHIDGPIEFFPDSAAGDSSLTAKVD